MTNTQHAAVINSWCTDCTSTRLGHQRSRLLLFSIGWSAWFANQSSTIRAKRCSAFCVHCTEIWECHSKPPRTPLAEDHGENTVSAVCSSVPLSSWYCSCVPCWRSLSGGRQWWSSASSFCWRTDASCSCNSSLNTWWPCNSGGGSYSLEHSTAVSQTFTVDHCLLQPTQSYSVFTFTSTGVTFNLRLLCVCVFTLFYFISFFLRVLYSNNCSATLSLMWCFTLTLTFVLYCTIVSLIILMTLTCKSIVKLGYRGERLMEQFWS